MSDSDQSSADPTILLVVEQMKEQNRITEKLADNVGELATKVAVSLEKHDHTEERQNQQDVRLDDLEDFQEKSKPIIDRSRWWQDALSDFAKTKLIPIILLAILAAAGISFYPSEITHHQQEQDK